MRAVTVSLLKRSSIYLVFIAILACDSSKEDFPEPEKVTFTQVEFYILPETSTIIDFNPILTQSFIGSSLTIRENPTKGTLTQMDASIFKYTPNADFVYGEDQFVFSAVRRTGAVLESGTIPIYLKNSEAQFPCGVYPVEDKVRLNPTSATVVHVSKNDRICEVNGPINVFIKQAPKNGEAVVVGDSIIYTPGTAFSIEDELIYGLSTSDGEEVSLGLVSFTNTKFEVLNVPSEISHVFFLDDKTGFIAGSDGIFKTIDGGRHWMQVPGLANEFGSREIYFEEIYFLDEHTAFAATISCDWWDFEDCKAGWIMTTNGGLSWKRTDLDQPVISIFFISSITGFMSTLIFDSSSPLPHQTIYKTIDGGETWDEVFSAQNSTAGLRIRFANDLVGYAYNHTAIYKTADGGQTWEPSVANEIISSFAIVDDDEACASFSSNRNFATMRTPSAIVRSENGSAWNPVSDFTYTIISQGFSPDGDFGLAVGLTAYDTDNYLMTISKSTDKGKTWVEVIKNADGYPLQISVPSANVAYILCGDKLLKYSP
jgi:photosystem II stability/assembly factor-like uncharacterized protein